MLLSTPQCTSVINLESSVDATITYYCYLCLLRASAILDDTKIETRVHKYDTICSTLKQRLGVWVSLE